MARKLLHRASLRTLSLVATALVVMALVIACEGITVPPTAEEPTATSEAHTEAAAATTEAPTATAEVLPVSIEIPTSSPTVEPLPGEEPFEGAELAEYMGCGSDMFMKIEGLNGESTDAKHDKWIDIISYSHSVSQPAASSVSTGGGRTSGRSEHGDFTVVKWIDKATPKLNLYCCNGKYIDKVVFEVCHAAGEKQEYMVYELEDVLIIAVSVSGSSGSTEGRPIEEVSLNYGRIKWTYTEYDETGKAKGNVEAQWNVGTNSSG